MYYTYIRSTCFRSFSQIFTPGDKSSRTTSKNHILRNSLYLRTLEKRAFAMRKRRKLFKFYSRSLFRNFYQNSEAKKKNTDFLRQCIKIKFKSKKLTILWISDITKDRLIFSSNSKYHSIEYQHGINYYLFDNATPQ